MIKQCDFVGSVWGVKKKYFLVLNVSSADIAECFDPDSGAKQTIIISELWKMTPEELDEHGGRLIAAQKELASIQPRMPRFGEFWKAAGQVR